MINSSKHHHHQTEFISPPVTPKLQLESSFNPHHRLTEEDGWDSASTTSSTSSTSSSSGVYCANTSPIMTLSSNHNYQRRRKQQKPMRSPPKSTKGTFSMPNFIGLNQLPAQVQLNQLTSITTATVATPTSSSLATATKKKRKYTDNEKDHCQATTAFNPLMFCLATEKKKDVLQPIDQGITNEKVKTTENTKEQTIVEPSIVKPITEDPSPTSPQQQEATTTDEETIIKKSKTSAALMYDHLTADCDQSVLFMNHEEWIPKLDVFDRRPAVRISWKGSPLKIRNMPYFEKLHAGEATIAATLRLTPEQYLKCKWALVLAAKEASENNTLFRKSEAQKVCCIDVNKTSVLWNAFGKLGWLGSKWPQ